MFNNVDIINFNKKCDLKSKLEDTENKLITKQSELNDLSLVLKNKSEILFDHEEGNWIITLR